MIEILPVYTPQRTDRLSRQNALLSFFSKNQYELFLIEKKENEEFKAYRKLEEIGIHSDLNCIDYVIIPKELIAKF